MKNKQILLTIYLFFMLSDLNATSYIQKKDTFPNTFRQGEILDLEKIAIKTNIKSVGVRFNEKTHFRVIFTYNLCKLRKSGYSVEIAIVDHKNKVLVSKLPNLFDDNSSFDANDICVDTEYSKELSFHKNFSLSIVATNGSLSEGFKVNIPQNL